PYAHLGGSPHHGPAQDPHLVRRRLPGTRSMTAMARFPVSKVAVGVLVGGGILLVVAANWHLVQVAVRSEPDCVAHVRPGEAPLGEQRYGAARSACRPAPAVDGRK